MLEILSRFVENEFPLLNIIFITYANQAWASSNRKSREIFEVFELQNI